VTHLLHVFSTFDPGGPQVRTVRLAEALGDGFRHTFVALDGRTGARELLPEGLAARVLDAPRKGTLSVVRWTRQVLAEERPDLLLTYNWGAIEVVLGSRGSAYPVLHHEDGFLPEESRRLLRRRTWTRRLLLPRVQGVVVPSHRLHTIAQETWRLDAAKVHLVPNGVHTADFAPRPQESAELRASLGIPADAPVVGSVGHLRPEKNPVRLVEAFARAGVAAAHLLVLGDGSERARVEEAVRRHGLEARVHLAGHRRDTVPSYGAMDVFCISSDTEQMPVALLEAMASGLAVASTDVGDVHRMLPGAQAPWVAGDVAGTPDDVDGATEALAGSLRGLLQDGETRTRLGAANREHVARHYAFEGMVDAYRALYLAAAGAVGSPG